MSKLKIPLFVALDVDSDIEALAIAQDVADYVGGFKIGPRLVLRYGAPLVKRLAERGVVFIDQKYHDIPSTMVSAVRASFNLGASFVTVHASAGENGLREVAALEKKLREQRPFQVLAVTVLTSMSDKTQPSNWNPAWDLLSHAQALAEDAMTAGLSGLVCSPYEVKPLRKKFESAFLLTPGIRMEKNTVGDQTRVSGPREALLQGSSALVVGRPIIEAENPRVAAQEFFDLIKDVPVGVT